jgi:hypothetical protein
VQLSESWRGLLEAVSPGHLPLEPACFIQHADTDTEVWTYWQPEAAMLVLAFRGTEQSSWRDFLTDISISPLAVNPQKVKGAPRHAQLAQIASVRPEPEAAIVNALTRAVEEALGPAAEASKETDEKNEGEEDGALKTGKETAAAAAAAAISAAEFVKKSRNGPGAEEAWLPSAGRVDETWVHGGFLGAWDSVRPQVLGLVDSVVSGRGVGGTHAGSQERKEWTVLVTGHSLGGALATLCAWDLALQYEAQASKGCGDHISISMVNFGSPRVGNRRFTEAFAAVVPDAWRVVNVGDGVVSIPRLMGYCHVGNEVSLSAEGAAEVQRDSGEARLDGVALSEVLPAAKAAMAAAALPRMPAPAVDVLGRVGLQVSAGALIALSSTLSLFPIHFFIYCLIF